MAKCLRCGGGNEWIEGTVKDEADDTGLLRAERDNAELGWKNASAACAKLQGERDSLSLKLDKTLAAGEEYYRQLMEERKLRHTLEQHVRKVIDSRQHVDTVGGSKPVYLYMSHVALTNWVADAEELLK